ncbi:MAG: membrane dipeptidase, partial [Planctomycetia bacterium]|nr:membrane dipeptidase [Planctomycetia bacterium]
MNVLRPLLLVLCVGLCIRPASSADDKPVQLTDAARKIHQEALLIDGHNDLPWQFRLKADLSFRKIDIARPQKGLHTDIPRLRQGGVGAQFWSAYVPVGSRKAGTAVKETLEQIDVIQRFVRAYPDDFEMAYGVEDILRFRKNGKIAWLIGVEGGHSIDNSLGVLRTYYQL